MKTTNELTANNLTTTSKLNQAVYNNQSLYLEARWSIDHDGLIYTYIASASEMTQPPD